MEDDERVQKLKAGKEKLAQFQKKKKKKKRSSQHDGAHPLLDIQVGESMEISSTLGMSAGANPVYDSDPQSQSTCSEDETSTEETSSKTFVQMKSKLLQSSQRVEELEESLAGKQLALDKVIQENDDLRRQPAQTSSTKADDKVVAEISAPVSHAVAAGNQQLKPRLDNTGDQPAVSSTGDQSQPAGNQQQFDMADVQELLQHVQWLQLHLKQANRTMELQNERQRTTVAALHLAREEIFSLKDNIECKDKLLSQLAEKLTQLSSQHDSLRKAHQDSLTDTTRNEDGKMEKELNRLKELLEIEFETSLETVKKDNEEKVQSVTERFEDQIKKQATELKSKIDQLEAESAQLQSSKDMLQQQLESLQSESDILKLSNESLTKNIETLKDDNKEALAKYNDVLSEKEHVQAELEVVLQDRDKLHLQYQEHIVLSDKIETLQAGKDELTEKLLLINENLDELKNENSSLLNENQDLIDEISKLKDDNNMYSKQLTEREDVISQHGEVMEENLSLRMQNDELYNKINNQKDLIASLKGELELVTCENFQLVDQMKEHTTDEERYKQEIGDLLQEKENNSKVIEDLKSQVDIVTAENFNHKETIASFESQINILKQSLLSEEPSKSVAVKTEPDNSEQSKVKSMSPDSVPDSVKMKMKPLEEQILVPDQILLSDETCIAESVPEPNQGRETRSKADEIFTVDNQLVLQSEGATHSQEQLVSELQQAVSNADSAKVLENRTLQTSFTMDRISTNGNHISENSAKTSHDDSSAKIQALQQEVLKLNNEIDRLQHASVISDNASVFATVSSQTSPSVVTSDMAEESATSQCEVNAMQDDTAYYTASEHSDAQTLFEVTGESENTQFEKLQLEFKSVSALLTLKQYECEQLKCELEEIKQDTLESVDVLQQMNSPESMQADPADSSTHLPVLQEVSDIVIPSLHTLELEVNLHASSTPSQHGTFSQQDNGVVGNVLGDIETQIIPCETAVINSDLEHETVNRFSGHCFQEAETLGEKAATYEQSDKTRKDQDNQNKINANLQQEIQSLNNQLQTSNEKCKMLNQENEKLEWERDELELKAQSLESQLNEMKTLICDKEFREEEIKEDYSSVKERLEYFESSASDCFEMRELLEKIQEEKENILQENESLQCSLSAKLSENDNLIKRLESSDREKYLLVKDIEDRKAKCSVLEDEIKTLEIEKNDFETKLTVITESFNEKENRLLSEIEGLLEENSTLKTKAQCLQSEIEIVHDENTRLNSFFPHIDKESETMTLQVKELEDKIVKASNENEKLVEELMDQEQKFTSLKEENDGLFEKCEQLQRIIEEMDDEKTELLNSTQLSDLSKQEKIKDQEAMIEKLECQLSGLDEENSTLKTQVLGLNQDIDEIKESKVVEDRVVSTLESDNDELKLQNAELSDKVLVLEQEFEGLVEQTKCYEQTVSSESDVTISLENDLKKMLDEKRSLEENCVDFKHENDKLRKSENYLKEQLQTYEKQSHLHNDSNSHETEQLCARIELEVKCKTKLQKDVEHYQQLLNSLEKEKFKLSDDVSNALTEVSVLKKTKLEDEKLIGDLSKELEIARNEKDELLIEMNSIDAQYQTVTERNNKLSQEVDLLQGHLQAVSENRNHIRNQTEILVSELEHLSTCSDSLTSCVNKLRQQNDDMVRENCELKHERHRLLQEIEELKTHQCSDLLSDTDTNHGNDLSMENNETSEDNTATEQHKSRLERLVENLKEQLELSEREREALENLTEDLTNMLRDMQTKYEEVKSEMENTKRNCDKEIGQLQIQLQEMNDNVLQLRKMLDLMENEVYHAAEEKVVLKENLEQQQAQYVEAVEQKQKLEEILGEKDEKDRKNLEMASRLNRSDEDLVTPENFSYGNEVVEQCQIERNTSVENTSSEIQLISHFSDEHSDVPTFESALSFFNFGDHDKRFVNSSAQTSIIGQCTVSTGVDISADSDKYFSTSATQTERLEGEVNEEIPLVVHAIEETAQTCQQAVNDYRGEDVCIKNEPPNTNTFPLESDCGTILPEKPSQSTDDLVTLPYESKESDKELCHDPERDIDCSSVEEAAGVLCDSGIKSPTFNTDTESESCLNYCDRDSKADMAQSNSGVDSVGVACTDIPEDLQNMYPPESHETQPLVHNSQAEIEILSKENMEKLEEEIERKLLQKFEFREKMIKSQEENYEKKLKQIEYDLEEEYEYKFRRREAEVMVEAESNQKQFARDIEHAAELQIEKIKKEKDRQFVETLQKVRDDLARRQGVHTGRSKGSKPGPKGDAAASGNASPERDVKVRQLRKDNEDLASARDALLHKIDITQQEHTAFHENLISIMGDDDLTSTSPQIHRDKMPAWLDWDIVPDLSFDSAASRSSLNTKSLSGSLDPSAFCTNSDCLSYRMKYEQLIEKIQQYLKIKPVLGDTEVIESEGTFTDEVCDSVNDEYDSPNIAQDRFVESNESDNQVLQRITSMHLEHFVREPSENPGQSHDQFVHEHEPDNSETQYEGNEDLVQAILDESQSDNDRNKDGHFTRLGSNERDDGTIDSEEKQQHATDIFVPFNQDRIRDEILQGQFCDDTDNDTNESFGARMRRHFSESDITPNSKTERDFQTLELDHSEGHFVLEKKTNATNDLERDLSESRDNDDVFHLSGEVELKRPAQTSTQHKQKNKKKPTSGYSAPKSLPLSSSFISERTNIEDKTPGSEAVLLPSDNIREPLTGEDSGDFFEEKIVRHVHRSLNTKTSNKPSFFSDSIEIQHSQSLGEEEGAVSRDFLETIRMEIEAQEKVSGTPIRVMEEKGNKENNHFIPQEFNEEEKACANGQNTSLSIDFDTSESVGKGLKDAKQKTTSNTSSAQSSYSSGKQSYENAIFDILNSICPGTDPSRIRGEFRPDDNQFQEVTDEFKDHSSKADTEVQELNNQVQILQGQLSEVKIEKEKIEKDIKEKESTNSELIKLKDKHSDLLNEFEELQKRNQHAATDFQDQINRLEKEKIEIENALLSQADSYDKLADGQKYHDELILKNSEMEKELAAISSMNEVLSKKNEEGIHLTAELESQKEKIENEVSSLKQGNSKLNSRIHDLTQTIDSCSKTLKEKECEVNKMREKDNEYLHQIHSLESKIVDCTMTSEELTQKCSCLLNENINLKASVDKQLSTLEEKQVELDDAINEKLSTQAELHKLLDETRKLKDVFDQLLHQVLGVSKGKEKLPTSDIEIVEEFKEKVMLLKQENDAFMTERKSCETLKEEKDALDKHISDMKELNAENEWAIKELGVQIENIEVEKQKLQMDHAKYMDENPAQIDALKVEITSMKEQVKNLSDEKCFLNEAVKELTDANSNLLEANKSLTCNMEGIKQLQDEKDALEHDLQEEKRQNEELNLALEKFTLVENPQAEMKNIEKETSNGNPSVETNDNMLSSEIEILKTENLTLKRRLDAYETNSDTENDCQILQELREELKSLQEEKMTLEKEIYSKDEKLEKDHASLSNEVEKLQEEIDNLKKKAKLQEDTLKKENTDILKMYGDLRNEVEILVISKHDLEVELHALKDLLEHEADTENGVPSQPARRDTSRELTMQDLEEMEELKHSIEQLKSDLKEKDDYVRKLEEHLLSINRGLPSITSSPKPYASRGEVTLSKRYQRKRSFLLEHGRRAFSHDLSENGSLQMQSSSSVDTTTEDWSSEQSVVSENQFVSGIHDDLGFKSSVNSYSRPSSSIAESFEAPERVKSGLTETEDGHLALEKKQFKLVDEITTLRRDFRETKALYAQEAVLLTEALEKEKAKKDLLETGRERNRTGSLTTADALKLKQEIAVVKEENKMLKLENERWILRMKDQEQIVLDLKDRLSRNTCGIDEIEEVFGRQLALLQKQREELVDKLKDKDIENTKLTTTLGEKGIIEETLRREKETLFAKLQEKSDIENELCEFKVSFEKQIIKRKQMEEIINQKDQNEIQLMKQKRRLEEELHEIESKFRDREGTLETEKHRLLDEIREARSVRISTYVSEDEEDTRSVCLDGSIMGGQNIEKLERMLEEVERQHSSAVGILRDQLKGKYLRREQRIKEDHAEGLKEIKEDVEEQV